MRRCRAHRRRAARTRCHIWVLPRSTFSGRVLRLPPRSRLSFLLRIPLRCHSTVAAHWMLRGCFALYLLDSRCLPRHIAPYRFLACIFAAAAWTRAAYTCSRCRLYRALFMFALCTLRCRATAAPATFVCALRRAPASRSPTWFVSWFYSSRQISHLYRTFICLPLLYRVLYRLPASCAA